jgi:hypothetical protein
MATFISFKATMEHGKNLTTAHNRGSSSQQP